MKRKSKIPYEKNVFLVTMLLACVFIGCAFPTQNFENVSISNIESELTFQKIRCQSFMGGSVLYNPNNPSSGQLAVGVTVAVRLGYVEKEENGIDEFVYKNIEDKASYGYITVESISKNELSFRYFSFDNAGLEKTSNSFTIKAGESLDINSDGLDDLTYDYPLRKRPGFEKALWLTFLSNKESQNTSMFAVLPEQYARGVYPSGIMGINPYGKFIVNKYEVNSSNRAAIQGAMYGDYVLDSQKGEYQKIISRSSYRYARNIEEYELETMFNEEEMDFHFKLEDFDEYMTVDGLLNQLPITMLANCDITFSNIEKLNYILEQKDLLNEIAVTNNYSLELSEIQEVNSYLDTVSKEEVVKFNRYLLQGLYPEECPSLDLGNDSIVSIFPLLSVYIANPDSENIVEETENQRSVEKIGTANNYRDYLDKSKKIIDKFDDFYPIKNFYYDFPGWDKVFNASSQSSTSNTSTNNDEDLRGEIGSFDDLVTSLMEIPKTDIPGKVENNFKLKLGVMGHFSISFTNVEGGIYAGVFISGDTSLDMTKTLAKYPVDNFSKIEIYKNETLLNINLKAFEAPPITIGILSLKFSLCGGIEIPVSVTLNGTVTTNFYAGFTGFYAAGFDVGANFGLKWKTQKIFGIPIPYSVSFYCNPYAKGDFINETASYVGPVSKITTIPGVKLQSGTFELNIKPSVYLEPGITVANCIYGGLKIRYTKALGIGASFVIDDSQQLPKKLDLYKINQNIFDIDGVYGIRVKIPIINKQIERKGSIDIPFLNFGNPEKEIIKEIIF
ncbi:MAG: hypothetical protein UIH41_01475 [Treponemataceae bacterium]|nr:hypothetical protein [Treponemataceae bacterium]